MFGVMFYADPEGGINELSRVVKSGGPCVVTTWHGKSRLLAPVAAAMSKMMPGSPVARAMAAPGVLSDKAELARRLEGAGLAGVKIHEVAHEFELSQIDYLDAFPRGNPAALAAMQTLPAHVYAIYRSLLKEELTREFGGGTVRLNGVANIAVGVRA